MNDDLILFIKETIDNEGRFNCETEEITLDSNGFDHVAENVADYVGDVRKETTKEIFEQLAKDDLMQHDNFGLVDLKEYAKQYGVEL